jgi:putative pre-16S rRNA nuclease
MRILCLDIGSKRIGVAASDPMGWTAQGICVIERRGGELKEIADLCREMDVDLILVGMPFDENGEKGPAAKKVDGFVIKLKEHLMGQGLDLPIEAWDERYSTAVAEERLIAADVSRAKRRKVIDKMAAMVILEDYLQAHQLTGDCGEGTEG